MPNNFQIVRNALVSAKIELRLQSKNFVLSRNNAAAQQLLKNATDLAKELTVDTPEAKADINARVEERLTLHRVLFWTRRKNSVMLRDC